MSSTENGQPSVKPADSTSLGAGLALRCAAFHLGSWLLMLLVGWPRVQSVYAGLLDGAGLPWPTVALFWLGKPACWALALVGTGLIFTLGQAAHPGWYRWTCAVVLVAGGLLGALGVLWPLLGIPGP